MVGLSPDNAAGIKFDVILTENHSDWLAPSLMMELYIVRQGSAFWLWDRENAMSFGFMEHVYNYRAAIDMWSEYVERTIYPDEIMRWSINLRAFIQRACDLLTPDISFNKLYISKISFTVEADAIFSFSSIRCDLHRLRLAYTKPSDGSGGGCPTLFVWNGTGYADEGVLDIHAESDITVQHEIQNTLTPTLDDDVYKLQLRELDNFTSHIDQVKLLAIGDSGEAE